MDSVSTVMTAHVFEHVDQGTERRRIRMNRANGFKGQQPKYKDELMRRSDPAKTLVA